MPYCSADNLHTVETWTIAAGTPVTSIDEDYDETRLQDGDPSFPFWIEENSLELQGDLGSAKRIDGIVLVHHDYAEGTRLRLRVHSAASWGGAVDITVEQTVGAWLGLFAPNVYFNVADEAPVEGDRTRQYFYLDQLDANDQPVKIGQLLVAGLVGELELGMMPRPHTPLTYGRSQAEGKKGPRYVHDWRTRARSWIGQTGLDDTDGPAFEAIWNATRAVLPWLAWPMNDIAQEPVFGLFVGDTYDPTWATSEHREVAIEFEERAFGEAY
jgi:hypothetical protein